MRAPFRRSRFPFLIASLIGVIGQCTAQTQDPKSDNVFPALLAAANASGEVETFTSLIRANRLLVKPFVDSILIQHALRDIEGNHREATRLLGLARSTADAFEKEFGEKSLSLAVRSMEGWSVKQKKAKVEADRLDALGTELRAQRQTRDSALTCYAEALSIYRAIGDERGQASVLGGFGWITYVNRDMDSCLSVYEQALAMRIRVDDRQLMGNAYNDIGYSIYSVRFKEYAKGIPYLLKAEALRAEIGDLSNLGRTQRRIGLTYEPMGALPDAYRYFAKAAEVFQSIDDAPFHATALTDCGIILRKMGNYTQALNSLRQSSAIYERLGDQRHMGDVLESLGITYRMIGDLEAAYQHYDRVLRIRERMNDAKGVAQVSTNIAILLRNIGRPEQAAEYIERSLATYREQKDTTGILNALSNLGLAYFDAGLIDTSERCMEEALRIAQLEKDIPGQISILINLGNTKNFKGELEEGLALYQEAYTLAERMNAPGLLWPSILGTGENYERRHDYKKAYAYYSRALEIIESLRGGLQSSQYKESFLATQRYVYEAVIHILSLLHQRQPEGGYDTLAFDFAERGKARAFLDLMAEAIAGIREGVDPALLTRQEKLLATISQKEDELLELSAAAPSGDPKIALLKSELSQLESEFNTLKIGIRQTNPRYADLQYPEPVSLTEVQSQLADEKTAILEYLVGDSSSALWVITQDERRMFVLPNRTALDEQLSIFRFALQNPTTASRISLTAAGYTLYAKLVMPALPFIRDAERLVIIPDDILHLLPFEALLTSTIAGESSLTFSKYPFLAHQHAISYAPSASIAVTIAGESGPSRAGLSGTFLAFGDPDFGTAPAAGSSTVADTVLRGGGFDRLVHSGSEVREIAGLFPEGASTVFLRSDATEGRAKESLREAAFQYVHFATHGVINENKPDFSSIVLTQDDNPLEDGFLRAAEILNLPVRADLVVLSACETGLGKMVRGEGVVGLTRAFMYAGTSSLLVSLWSVSDRSTSELMKEFYRNMIVSSMDKTRALQSAKLTMMQHETYGHPFYWAPFVLIGKPN